jgi:hypothetical protein
MGVAVDERVRRIQTGWRVQTLVRVEEASVDLSRARPQAVAQELREARVALARVRGTPSSRDLVRS